MSLRKHAPANVNESSSFSLVIFLKFNEAFCEVYLLLAKPVKTSLAPDAHPVTIECLFTITSTSLLLL